MIFAIRSPISKTSVRRSSASCATAMLRGSRISVTTCWVRPGAAEVRPNDNSRRTTSVSSIASSGAKTTIARACSGETTARVSGSVGSPDRTTTRVRPVSRTFARSSSSIHSLS